MSFDEVPVMGMNGFQDPRSVLGREIRLEQIPAEMEALREKFEADIEALEAARDKKIQQERNKAVAELAPVEEAIERNKLAWRSVMASGTGLDNLEEMGRVITEEQELEERRDEIIAAFNEKRVELIVECQNAIRAIAVDFEHTNDLLAEEQLRFQDADM